MLVRAFGVGSFLQYLALFHKSCYNVTKGDDKMAVPNIDDLFAPIITCLSDGKIHSLKELTEYCAVALNLSKNDIEQRLDDGRTKLYFRVGWAKQHLKKQDL